MIPLSGCDGGLWYYPQDETLAAAVNLGSEGLSWMSWMTDGPPGNSRAEMIFSVRQEILARSPGDRFLSGHMARINIALPSPSAERSLVLE